MLEDSKRISEAIEVLSAHKRGINTEGLQEGFSASAGELGFSTEYNFNRTPETGVASDMEEIASFFNGYEINKEEIERIKTFHKRMSQTMSIDEGRETAAYLGNL